MKFPNEIFRPGQYWKSKNQQISEIFVTSNRTVRTRTSKSCRNLGGTEPYPAKNEIIDYHWSRQFGPRSARNDFPDWINGQILWFSDQLVRIIRNLNFRPISNQKDLFWKTKMSIFRKIELFEMLISNLAPRFWREFCRWSLLESFRRAYIESRA